MTSHDWHPVKSWSSRAPASLSDLLRSGIPLERCGRCGGWRVMGGSYLLRAVYGRANPVFDDCDLEMACRIMES